MVYEYANMCKEHYGAVPGPVLSLDIAFLQGRGDLDWGRLFDLFRSPGIQRAAIPGSTPAQSGPSPRYQTLMALLNISTAEESDE